MGQSNIDETSVRGSLGELLCGPFRVFNQLTLSTRHFINEAGLQIIDWLWWSNSIVGMLVALRNHGRHSPHNLSIDLIIGIMCDRFVSQYYCM